LQGSWFQRVGEGAGVETEEVNREAGSGGGFR
jgi:hypothetical protein